MRKTHPTITLLLFAAVLALVVVPGEHRLLAQTWVPKGPAPGFDGGNSTSSGNPIGGALEAVVAHPTNPNVLWVGSVNGGVFRTDNATSSSPNWTAQTDFLGPISIGDLALDPTDASHNTLVAGIGSESSFLVGGALSGLLRTTDGGATWTPLTALSGKKVVGVAPRGNTIVAAVDGPGSSCNTLGIWRSTNGGASFTRISNGPGLPCGFSYDLASDPTNNNRLFAPVTGVNGPSDGLYRSTNAGATWVEVGSGSAMDAALQSDRINVHVAVGRRGGANANVFVAVCNGQKKLKGLFYSGNAGTTWSTLDLPTTVESGTAYGTHPGSQCDLHLSLVADPVDHSVVYIGGDRQPSNNEPNTNVGSFWPNSIGATGYYGRLFKVDADAPAGSQATSITFCETALPGCKGARRTANNTAPHADSRDMVFDANGDLIQTDDGGVYRHTDPRGSSGDWQSVIGDLNAVEQHSAAYDTVSNVIISGNQDNGTTLQASGGAAFWLTVFGGDGGDVGAAAGDPVANQSTRYWSAQNIRGFTRSVFDANNVLQSQAFPSLTPLGGSPQLQGQFVTPIEVNAAAPWRLVIGGANGIYESFDRGDSITMIANVPVTQGGFGPLAYGVASNPDALYFGVQNVVYYRVGPPPAFVPFNTLPGGGIDTDVITGVVIDPDNSLVAAAVDRNSVYGTNNITQVNGGWINVTGNLFAANPNAGDINVVEWVNRASGDLVVIGTKRGVYAATAASGFQSWSPLGTGLPNALVYDLHYDKQNDVLMANTMGRGTWTLSFDANCPWERVFSNSTLNAPLTGKAEAFIYLGPSLTVSNGSGITMRAGQEIQIGNDTSIGGSFTAALGPCP